MAFSTDELSQIKFFLRYGNLTVNARPYFDIARIFEDVVQKNMDAWGENFTRTTILPNLNQLEIDIMNCRTRFAADAIGGLKRNPHELRDLLELRDVWVERLHVITKVETWGDDGRGPNAQSVTVT